MPRTALALAFVLTAATLAHAAQPPVAIHKYDIKSGIVTLETAMQMGTFAMKTQATVYFDDYGMKECKETTQNGKLTAATFSDGKAIYALKIKSKTAAKIGDAFRGTEVRMDYDELGTKKDRDSGKVKKIAPMQIAGKTCEAYAVTAANGEVTQYAGYKKFMVYLKTGGKSMTTIIKAVKIEENAAVPADKFKIPAGYTVSK